jgi:hypothetical protein
MKKITKNPDTSTEPLVGGPAIAKHYDCHDGTIRRWKKEGCPFHPYGRKMIRFRLSEVEAWLNQRSVSKPAAAVNYCGLRNQPAAAQ